MEIKDITYIGHDRDYTILTKFKLKYNSCDYDCHYNYNRNNFFLILPEDLKKLIDEYNHYNTVLNLIREKVVDYNNYFLIGTT